MQRRCHERTTYLDECAEADGLHAQVIMKLSEAQAILYGFDKKDKSEDAMKKPPILRIHKKSCFNCRYFRKQRLTGFTDCLLLGRMLSMANDCYPDLARVCDGWKRRPKTRNCYTEKNPFWEDKYISRESQEKIRKRHGIAQAIAERVKDLSKEKKQLVGNCERCVANCCSKGQPMTIYCNKFVSICREK